MNTASKGSLGGISHSIIHDNDNSNNRNRNSPMRRNVWSDSVGEENEWIDALWKLWRHRHGFIGLHGELVADDGGKLDGRVDNISPDIIPSVIPSVAPRIIPRVFPSNNDINDADLNASKSVHGKIPRRIHFIWLGPDPIPRFPFLPSTDNEEQQQQKYRQKHQWNECMLSWKKHHPTSRGWICKLWTLEDVCLHSLRAHGDPSHANGSGNTQDGKIKQLHNSKQFLSALHQSNYGMASDILRLELLYMYGGVYVDVDYYCLSSLDDLCGFYKDNNFGSDHEEDRDCIREFFGVKDINGLTNHRDIKKKQVRDNFAADIVQEIDRQCTTETMKNIQFYCGMSNTGCLEINNGLIGCAQGGHQILWNMMKSIDNIECNDILHSDAENDNASKSHSGFKNKNSNAVPQLSSLLSSFLDQDASTMDSLLSKVMSSSITSTISAQSTSLSLSVSGNQRRHEAMMNVIEQTGPGLLTRAVCRWLIDQCNQNNSERNDEAPNEDYQDEHHRHHCRRYPIFGNQVMVLPYYTFHPFPNHLRHELRSSSPSSTSPLSKLNAFVVPEKTVAVHLWGCSWQKK